MTDFQIDEQLAADLRRAAFPLLYRMVGSVAEAEDLLQEGLLRLQVATLQGTTIASPHGFLVSVTTRLAIDHLRSARHKRELYPGEWLPEPVVQTAHTATAPERMEMAESLSMAFLVLLETLSPLERAVFLLRQIFDYEYAEIAQIVGKSEPNCRQAFSRARKHIAARRRRFEPARDEHVRLVQQFLSACNKGSLPELEALLAADVEFHGDGGGVASAVAHPVIGANRVARLLRGIFAMAATHRLQLVETTVNAQLGLLFKTPDGALLSVMSLQVLDGKIAAVHSIINPDKLQHLGHVSNAARLRPPQTSPTKS